MSLGFRKPHTDHVTGQLEECLLDFCEPVQATPQAAKRMEPGDGALHEPTEYAQTTTMLRIASGQHWMDSQPPQDLPQRFGIIATIAEQLFGFFSLGSRLAANWRHVQQDLYGLRDFVDIRRRHRDGQGDALRI